MVKIITEINSKNANMVIDKCIASSDSFDEFENKIECTWKERFDAFSSLYFSLSENICEKIFGCVLIWTCWWGSDENVG